MDPQVQQQHPLLPVQRQDRRTRRQGPQGTATEAQPDPSRELLRKEPAPILMTNATMLEYMLVRQVDNPILEISRQQKSLRWIVLDEAHTYVGSQAAEMSLLLRRVVPFGRQSEQIRFIATSATIAGADAQERLKHTSRPGGRSARPGRSDWRLARLARSGIRLCRQRYRPAGHPGYRTGNGSIRRTLPGPVRQHHRQEPSRGGQLRQAPRPA